MAPTSALAAAPSARGWVSFGEADGISGLPGEPRPGSAAVGGAADGSASAARPEAAGAGSGRGAAAAGIGALAGGAGTKPPVAFAPAAGAAAALASFRSRAASSSRGACSRAAPCSATAGRVASPPAVDAVAAAGRSDGDGTNSFRTGAEGDSAGATAGFERCFSEPASGAGREAGGGATPAGGAGGAAAGRAASTAGAAAGGGADCAAEDEGLRAGGASLSTVGSTVSRGTVWITPTATAPIVAAAASGIHQRHGPRASAGGSTRGLAPAARCAAARIASSTCGDGSSRIASRQARSTAPSRIPRGSLMRDPPVPNAASRTRSARGS